MKKGCRNFTLIQERLKPARVQSRLWRDGLIIAQHGSEARPAR